MSNGANQDLAPSELTLLRMIGLLGVMLPFVLLFGGLLAPERIPMQTSISQYYHTNMGYLFVSIMLATGAFLICYRGYGHSPRDDLATTIAGVFAIGTGVLPPGHCEVEIWASRFHWLSAGVFFVMTGVISCCIFTKSGQQKANNRVYKWCAGTIWACVVGLAVYFLVGKFIREPLDGNPPIVWILEALAVVAFGLSWLVKSRMINRWRQNTNGA